MNKMKKSEENNQSEENNPSKPETMFSIQDTNASSSTPGAFRVEGFASREQNSVGTGNKDLLSDNPTSESDIECPVLTAEFTAAYTGANASTMTGPSTEQGTPPTSEVDISTAYLVEERTVYGEATVLKTLCGIEKKYFVVIFVLAIGTLIAIVLGIDTSRGDGSSSSPQPFATCGPLCGAGAEVPSPEQIVLGRSCEDWSLASLLPDITTNSTDEAGSSSCENKYSAAAYACGCPDASTPSDGCGSLCSSGALLPDPDKVVADIHGTEFTCSEWELLSKFGTESNDFCANYNAVGVLCGCQDNVPPPDACGSLCGADNTLPRPSVVVWGMTCEDWNTMSIFLPAWQGDDGDFETCSQIFQDVAYRCECPGVEPPPDQCNALCEERSFCGASMCQDNSPILYPDNVVRGLACKDWSFFSRLTDHPEMCYFYEMIGAECGCNNVPPSNACGPLCGENYEITNPSQEVRGQTCKDWNSMSTFLFPGYGTAMPNTASMISSTCDNFFSPLAYGCGCPTAEPPENGCGLLCNDGLPVPDPDKIVLDSTCGDYEALSLFETKPNSCYMYKNIIAKQCGCKGEASPEDEFWNTLKCFVPEALDDKIFHYFSGMTQYYISFGETGTFLQIQSQESFITVGKFADLEFTATNNTAIDVAATASYGGGDRCGQYGPRRGSVVLVEDESVVVPEIISVIEPSTCVYRATLAVPKICQF